LLTRVQQAEVSMRRMTVVAGACVVMLAGVSLVAQQARGTAAPAPTLQSAIAALNVTSLRTVQFTATGRSFVLGQPPTATEPWPARQIKSYTAQIEYGTNSMRIEQVLTMPTPAPRGGGVAITGEQRQNPVHSRRLCLERNGTGRRRCADIPAAAGCLH